MVNQKQTKSHLGLVCFFIDISVIYMAEGGILLLHKMKKAELMNHYDIWNAMVSIMAEYNFPTENKTANKAYIIYTYYSEMESGGHEGLFHWFSWYIEDVGGHQYFTELIRILKEINADEYSLIEEKYGEKLWNLFQALENGEIPEEAFYSLNTKADIEYTQLSGKLGDLLEDYFVSIYRELIEVMED